MQIRTMIHHVQASPRPNRQELVSGQDQPDNPLVFKNLSEEQIDKRLEDLAIVLQKEYGQPKEPGHDELLIDVKKCA